MQIEQLSNAILSGKTVAAILVCMAPIAACAQPTRAATFYVGRISSVNAWHDLFTSPSRAEFVDSYLAVAALSHEFARQLDGDVSWDVEGQVGYNFGDQSHWEFNAAFGPRWHAFPWSSTVEMSVAFLFGASMATEVPQVEVELEGDSDRLLIYWCLELAAGPPRSDWVISLRLHHRSGGFGFVADDGGMNAVALGARIGF